MPPSPPLPGITRDEDSWLEEFTFYLNSQEFDLAHRKLSLKDGTNNTWELRAKEDSALINATSVALWMSGGDALQLVFEPPLFQPQPVTTAPLSWSILTKASHWGSFTLELRSPHLPTRSIDAEVNVHGT
ncbi:hypothetical protein ACFQDJ_18230 [Pseudomonas brassicacearum]